MKSRSQQQKSAWRLVGLSLFVVMLFLIPGIPHSAQAAPGDLDPSFGGTGKVTTAIGTADDKVNSLAIQPDGKLVAAGYSNNGSQNEFALARYNTDGSLDTTFNTTGKVTTPIGTQDDKAFAVAIQSDGKLVLAGYSNNGVQNKFALVRYNTDGSTDTSFGTEGIVTTAIGHNTINGDEAFALAIQSDGKLVAAGYSTIEGARRFALVRYYTDGSLDTTFGTGGFVTTPIGGDSRAFSLAIQSDGKLVAAGVALGFGDYDFALARYNSDGTLDTGFGTGGIVTTDLAANDDDAKTLAIQSDGKPVLAGHAFVVTQRKFPLARYNTNGTLDSSFGSGGIVTTAIGTSDARVKSLAIQSDGKLVAAGFSNNGNQNEFALARYNTDGSLDTTFGMDGIVTTAIGTIDDEANALVIQPDGKMVAAGFSNNGSQDEFALVRYLGDLIEETTTTTTTSTTTTTTEETTTTTSTTTSTTTMTEETTTTTTTTSTTTTTTTTTTSTTTTTEETTTTTTTSTTTSTTTTTTTTTTSTTTSTTTTTTTTTTSTTTSTTTTTTTTTTSTTTSSTTTTTMTTTSTTTSSTTTTTTNTTSTTTSSTTTTTTTTTSTTISTTTTIISTTTTTTTSTTTTTLSLPTISRFTPNKSVVDTSVTIYGKGFTGATAVQFNGTAATLEVLSSTRIRATVPAGACPSTGPISVSTPSGTVASANSFTCAATLSNFSPKKGVVDTIVTIHGKGFTGSTAVQFNGSPATFEVLSSTRIRATVPAGACPSTGPISVSTPSGTVASVNSFTCAATLSNFSPNKGVVDTIVTIHGKGFTGTTAVQFNGTPATTFEVLSPTRIQATVPAGATTGPISVNTPSGPATSEKDFTIQ